MIDNAKGNHHDIVDVINGMIEFNQPDKGSRSKEMQKYSMTGKVNRGKTL